jgi:ketosteroid isomerase-like protein
MRSIVALVVLAVAVTVQGADKTATPQENDPLAIQIIQLERSAIESWNKGDPSMGINLLSDDITYFDPNIELRLDGKEGKATITKYCEAARGKIHVEKYEMINPRVQSVKDMAVLSYNLISVENGKTSRWNCTGVYKLEEDGKWKVIHQHWSPTRPVNK